NVGAGLPRPYGSQQTISYGIPHRSVERYLSPVDGMIATINLPLFSGRWPTLMAATTAAPEEIPQRIPSSLIRRLAMANASSLETCTTSSMSLVSTMLGMNPAPIPWILCGPGAPPERTGDVVGSTAIALNDGLRSPITCLTPVIV